MPTMPHRPSRQPLTPAQQAEVTDALLRLFQSTCSNDADAQNAAALDLQHLIAPNSPPLSDLPDSLVPIDLLRVLPEDLDRLLDLPVALPPPVRAALTDGPTLYSADQIEALTAAAERCYGLASPYWLCAHPADGDHSPAPTHFTLHKHGA